MPKYTFKLDDGRKVKIDSGTRNLSQDELKGYVNRVKGATETQIPTQGRNLNLPTSFGQPLTQGSTATPVSPVDTRKVGGRSMYVPGTTSQQIQEGASYLPFALTNQALFGLPGLGMKYENLSPGQQMAETLATPIPFGEVGTALIGGKRLLMDAISRVRPDRLEKAAATIIGAEARVQGKASKLFGEGLDKIANANPTKQVDITDALNTVRIERDFDPVINAISNAKGQLSNVLKGSGGDVTIKEAQEMVGQLSSIAKRAAPGDPKFHTLRTVIDDIKSSIADSFPEYKEVAKQYRESTKPLRIIRKKVTQGAKGDPALLSADLENKMAKNWNQNSVVRRQLKEVTTKKEWAELEKIRKEQGVMAFMRKLLKID